MLETINSVIAAISGVLYQPWFVPLFLVVSGIYFTFRCKFIQIRLFRDACRVIMEKPESEGSISSFGALMISTASRVGTGNIIGVSTAICLGGPGAIFWMWVTALLGGATAFIESTLAADLQKACTRTEAATAVLRTTCAMHSASAGWVLSSRCSSS